MAWEKLPEYLRTLKTWVVWKKGPKKDDGKFAKVPYYVSGGKRTGQQGSEADVSKLATWDEVIEAMSTKKYEGIGLAMLPDNGLVVLDCDNCVDEASGDVEPWALEVCSGTYTEYSPSGRGLRAIFLGEATEGKNHKRGFEVFHDKGFVTITGQALWEDQDLLPLSTERGGDLLKLLDKKKISKAENSNDNGTTTRRKERAKRHESITRIKSALDYLDANDREVWLKVGWAIGREFDQSDKGWELYLEWASTSSKFKEEGTEKMMREEYFEGSKEDRDPQISISTIYYLAKERGWKSGPFQLTDFYAYLPTHQYFHVKTRALWPASSVDSCIYPWPAEDGHKLPPSNKIDRDRPVEQATWHPGSPAVIEDKVAFEGGWIESPGSKVFNLYRPPLVMVGGRKEEIKIWRDHLHHIFPTDAEHITNWLAHRLQFPGDKINHALVLGGGQGIGKDTIVEPAKKAVGPWNFKEINPTAMLGRFNGWVKSVIVRVNEIRDLGDVDRFAFYDHSKIYLASPPDVIMVDEKHMKEYPVFNVAGYIFTTNYKTSGMYLPPDDRRHYVCWSEVVKEDLPLDHFELFYHWLDREGGHENVAEFLMARDLSKWNPKAPPPLTEAWYSIVYANASPEDAELGTLIGKMGKPDAVTLQMLINASHLHDEEGLGTMLEDRRARRRVPHILERSGYILVRNPSAPKTGGYWTVWGKQCAVYAQKTLSVSEQISAAEKLTLQPTPL